MLTAILLVLGLLAGLALPRVIRLAAPRRVRRNATRRALKGEPVDTSHLTAYGRARLAWAIQEGITDRAEMVVAYKRHLAAQEPKAAPAKPKSRKVAAKAQRRARNAKGQFVTAK